MNKLTAHITELYDWVIKLNLNSDLMDVYVKNCPWDRLFNKNIIHRDRSSVSIIKPSPTDLLRSRPLLLNAYRRFSRGNPRRVRNNNAFLNLNQDTPWEFLIFLEPQFQTKILSTKNIPFFSFKSNADMNIKEKFITVSYRIFL